jgi:hypothetical protein
MMGNTVKSRVLIIHDGKYSQISCSYIIHNAFINGKYSQIALSITQISRYPGELEI